MTIQDAKTILKGMTREAVYYWITVMIEKEGLTEAEAGYLLLDLGM